MISIRPPPSPLGKGWLPRWRGQEQPPSPVPWTASMVCTCTTYFFFFLIFGLHSLVSSKVQSTQSALTSAKIKGPSWGKQTSPSFKAVNETGPAWYTPETKKDITWRMCLVHVWNKERHHVKDVSGTRLKQRKTSREGCVWYTSETKKDITWRMCLVHVWNKDITWRMCLVHVWNKERHHVKDVSGTRLKQRTTSREGCVWYTSETKKDIT